MAKVKLTRLHYMYTGYYKSCNLDCTFIMPFNDLGMVIMLIFAHELIQVWTLPLNNGCTIPAFGLG